MTKTINFKYYFTLFFVVSYLTFIFILSLRAIPYEDSNTNSQSI